MTDRKYLLNTLDDWADAVHSLAWEKGWHSETENEDHFVERACNNLHDEVSGLHDAWRNNKLHALCDKAEGMPVALTCIEEEYADIIIRVLDNCRKLGVDIAEAVNAKHEYNKTRPYRHGGKRS